MTERGIQLTRSASEPAGLEDLYLRHAREATSLAYLLTGERETAEDLVQEAFIRLAGRFAHIRDVGSFGAYLRRTIVNLHTSRLRRLRRERAFAATARRDQASAMPDVAQREDVWSALHRLPGRQRAALVLRYHLDLSEKQAADVLGCSEAALKSLVTRGLRTLRTMVEER